MSNGREPKPHTETFENAPLTGGGYAVQGRPTFKQKVVNHYKRFWWLHLAVFIALALLITLLLIFVAFPRIAQDGINSSKLNLTAQTNTNPTPETQDLYLESFATSNSVFHPRLDAFNASLYLPEAGPDKPFVHITIPSLKTGKETQIIVNQTVTIADMDQFIAYNKKTLNSETYQVGFQGRTALHEGSFPVTHVNYQKIVDIKGLNGLKGFKVQTLNVTLQPRLDGSNTFGSVLIPNPSVLTITLGNITQNLSVDNTPIGNTTLNNVVLKPGDNIVNMTGISDQPTVLKMITSKYKNGILPVKITGNSSVYNGQHIPYYEAALQGNVLNAELDVGKALQAIGINVTALAGMGSSSSSSASGSKSSSSAAPLFPGASSSSSAAPLFPTESSSSSAAPLFPAASSSSSEAPLFPAASSSSSSGLPLFNALSSIAQSITPTETATAS